MTTRRIAGRRSRALKGTIQSTRVTWTEGCFYVLRWRSAPNAQGYKYVLVQARLGNDLYRVAHADDVVSLFALANALYGLDMQISAKNPRVRTLMRRWQGDND